MAAIWGELERRGIDLTDLKRGVGNYLSQIAAGRILPQLVVAYFGEPGTVNRLARLPAHDQQQVVATGTLPWAKPPHKPRPRQKERRNLPSAEELEDGNATIPAAPAGMEGAVTRGGSRDVADMLLKLILKSGNPMEVATLLIELLGERGLATVID